MTLAIAKNSVEHTRLLNCIRKDERPGCEKGENRPLVWSWIGCAFQAIACMYLIVYLELELFHSIKSTL